MSRTLETGDAFFFYRNTVDVDRARGLDDVQRLDLILVPDEGARARVLVVGRKRLPAIDGARAESDRRGWAMTLGTGAPEELARGLGPIRYETETRGRRLQPEAIPAAAGRYAIDAREGETFFVWRMTLPDEPGEAQRALGLRREAVYTLAVRNPEVEVPGFPDAKPDYPARLREAFGDMRWIEVSDPELLDHENAQMVLIGATDRVEREEAGLAGEPDLFGRLDLDPAQWPQETLREGRFAEALYEAPASPPLGDRSKGGRRGGREALKTASAAGVAKALEGVELPRDRAGLVAHARRNDAPDEVLRVLEEFPDRTFHDMAEVAEALGEVR